MMDKDFIQEELNKALDLVKQEKEGKVLPEKALLTKKQKADKIVKATFTNMVEEIIKVLEG